MFRIFLTALTTICLTSCSTMTGVVFDNIFDTESSADRKIRKDTERMQAGQPLKHFPSERRLRTAREDRLINQLQSW
jgi:hypothetical protein